MYEGRNLRKEIEELGIVVMEDFDIVGGQESAFAALDAIQESTIGTPVLLASFPQLWPLGDLKNWVITVMKTKLVGSRAKFMSQYHKVTRVMECFIILDTAFFVGAKVPCGAWFCRCSASCLGPKKRTA